PRHCSGSARISTLAVFDHFSAPLQSTNLCNTGDCSPIPTHLKLKSGIHDFSSCLPAGAQDGTRDGKDHYRRGEVNLSAVCDMRHRLAVRSRVVIPAHRSNLITLCPASLNFEPRFAQRGSFFCCALSSPS